MMRPGCILALFGLLLLVATSCEARRTHRDRLSRHRLHSAWKPPDEDGEDESDNHLAKHDDQDECHRGALHKCGQTFLRAHKLLSYLDDDLVAFRTRCGVRTAFFECLKTTREKLCSRPFRPHPARVESDFRKKLTDTLWSTRVCVLGVKSFTVSSSTR